MQIKLGKFLTDVPAWVVALGVLALDNMYANHCNKKSNENAVKAAVDSSKNQVGKS